MSQFEHGPGSGPDSGTEVPAHLKAMRQIHAAGIQAADVMEYPVIPTIAPASEAVYRRLDPVADAMARVYEATKEPSPEVTEPAAAEGARTEREPIPLSQYEGMAEQVVRSQQYYRKQGVDLTDPVRVAELEEIYLEDGTDDRMNQFAKLLIQTPAQMKILGQLRADEAGTIPLNGQAGHLKDQRIDYHNLVRDVVLGGRDSFDRATLSQWMNDAGDNRFARWGRDELAGVLQEIAAFDALEELGATLGTKRDDRRGADLFMPHGGVPVAVDVKFASHDKRSGVRASNGRPAGIQLAIDADWIEGFTVTDKGKERIQAVTKELLSQL